MSWLLWLIGAPDPHDERRRWLLSSQSSASTPALSSKRPIAAMGVNVMLGLVQSPVPLSEMCQAEPRRDARYEEATSARPSPLKSATIRPETESVNFGRKVDQPPVPP